ncbi:PAF-acetylhydrolase family member [Colletotrichum navitas]|uniref:Putative phospholipase n=1 Tax=Colletotrichum navitas TaxID=681940 RepID=A0AAD8PMI0_9PEZI|nr:PAF-acetylhydrolase family member [Colletotrichum navitas]KAK1570099.1 PAF-acetylhydrolase family member [Colletotrichum navitas]
MAGSPLPSYSEIDVELETLADSQYFDSPDSPLPLLDYDDDHHHTDGQTLGGNRSTINIMSSTPKWMRTAQPLGRSLYQKALAAVQPRLTFGYVAWSLISLYVLYCILARSPLFASKLPGYSGPYEVGAIDVEVPVRTPRKISEQVLESDGKPAFELETVLFTLYYPAAKGSSGTGHHYWIPRPISITAEGYARAAHFNNFISRPVFTLFLWAIAGSIKIPAHVDVPLLKDEEEEFSVVVLSHGQASSRTDYTHYCGELASLGTVVAAIEHRDGSGPGSVVMSKDGKERKVMYLNKKELRGGKEMKSDDFKFQQLAFRQAEIEETIAVLQELHAGKGATVFANNARKEGRGLAEWESRLNFSQTVIAGHSLGATGALQVLRGATSAKNPAVGGIILDPGKSSGRLNTDIDVPILIIHSDSWSKKITPFFGRPHFDTVRDIARDVLKRVGSSWFVTSLRTSHPSVTDAPLIEPLLLSWTTGATIGAHRGLKEYVRVSQEFMDFLRNGSREGVLSEDVTHEEYGKDTMTEEQRRRMPKETTKYWQIHVAPPREE